MLCGSKLYTFVGEAIRDETFDSHSVNQLCASPGIKTKKALMDDYTARNHGLFLALRS